MSQVPKDVGLVVIILGCLAWVGIVIWCLYEVHHLLDLLS